MTCVLCRGLWRPTYPTLRQQHNWKTFQHFPSPSHSPGVEVVRECLPCEGSDGECPPWWRMGPVWHHLHQHPDPGLCSGWRLPSIVWPLWLCTGKSSSSFSSSSFQCCGCCFIPSPLLERIKQSCSKIAMLGVCDTWLSGCLILMSVLSKLNHLLNVSCHLFNVSAGILNSCLGFSVYSWSSSRLDSAVKIE